MITRRTRTRACRCSQCWQKKARVHTKPITEVYWEVDIPGVGVAEFDTKRGAVGFAKIQDEALKKVATG